MVGQSAAFAEWVWPLVARRFPVIAASGNPERLYGAMNRVQPSLIRVEADEVRSVSLSPLLQAKKKKKFNQTNTRTDGGGGGGHKVTYPLHIVLRFEIEAALFAGTLTAADVPRVWREKMIAYLGVEPTSDSTGALQDVHWSEGQSPFSFFSVSSRLCCHTRIT
jgi:carboxypeptidase Taq